jgi:hypothetical protein
MGEFGVNDYSFSLLGKTMPQVRSIVPDVVRTITKATEVTVAITIYVCPIRLPKRWQISHGLMHGYDIV